MSDEETEETEEVDDERRSKPESPTTTRATSPTTTMSEPLVPYGYGTWASMLTWDRDGARRRPGASCTPSSSAGSRR